MHKTIVSALALLASTVMVSASDIPSKTKAPATPLPTFAQSQDFYAGLNGGGNLGTDRVYSGGAVAGWNVLPFLAVEGTYDYSRPTPRIYGKRDEQNTVAVNVLPQYRIGNTPFKVYGLGGVGYSWNSVTENHSIYNVGGGVKYEFSKNFEVDGRYRHIDSIETKFRGDAQDRVTLGVNYKF